MSSLKLIFYTVRYSDFVKIIFLGYFLCKIAKKILRLPVESSIKGQDFTLWKWALYECIFSFSYPRRRNCRAQ